MPSPRRYTSTAITLHWLTFALIAGGFSLALYMVDLPLSPLKLKYFAWHKWIGVTVFLLVLTRIAWRLTHRPPALPPDVPLWQRRAAGATHILLYALIVIIPISGWLYSSASGVPTVYFGVLPLPDLVTKDKALAAQLKSVHVTLNYTLLAVVIAHVAAAIKHHFFERDDVLRRMLPCVKCRPGNPDHA